MSPAVGETVLIVIPFAGTAEELAATAAAWQGLEDVGGRVTGIVLVENSREPRLPQTPGVSVIAAPDHGSSYYARNVGAAAQTSDWILFVDADCIPDPAIVDEYFAQPLGERVGAVVGGIQPAGGDSLVARYSAARSILDPDQAGSLEEGASAVTANLLVRRAAFDACGGFCEGIRSGGDIDFSWRLQERGWVIAQRRMASAHHLHRESVRDLVKQYRRYGAGYGWLRRRYAALDSARFDGTHPTLGGLRTALRATAGAGRALARGDRDEVTYALLDAVAALAWVRGVWDDNRPRWRTAGTAFPDDAADVADAILEIDGVRELRGRPFEPRAAHARGRAVRYWEDDGYAERVGAIAPLGSRLLRRGRLASLAAVLRFGRDFELAPVARRFALAQRAQVHAPEHAATAVLVRTTGHHPDPRDSPS